jgi:hypothetical protein
MNALFSMATVAANRALLITAHAIGYSSDKHRYYFREDKVKGDSAKLHISRATLKQFVTQCGACNTVGLPHLQVLEQGSGWYLVAADYPHFSGVVAKFLRRLNKWVLKHTQGQQQTRAPKHGRYVVEIPTRGMHKPVAAHDVHSSPTRPLFDPHFPPDAPKPTLADIQQLQRLAASLNAKYRH